jgi:hypothetical protein
MTNKKTPTKTPILEGDNSSLKDKENINFFSNNLQVHISKRGYVLHGFKRTGKPKPENLKKREEGDIVGWSTESRRRLRRYLMDYQAPNNWQTYSLTLTVPGPVLEPKQYKEMWEVFRKRVSKKPLLMVWRAEVQKRKAIHWHCVLSLPKDRNKMTIIDKWWDVITELGTLENYETKNMIVSHADSRMCLFGAMEHSVDIQEERENDTWWRYLADHTSKSKQEQVGENIGRHWGVIGRVHAVPTISDEVCQISDTNFFRLHRLLRRMSTPRIKDERDPFGYRLGWAPTISKFGRSDRFGRGQAVKRLIGWIQATGEDPF